MDKNVFLVWNRKSNINCQDFSISKQKRNKFYLKTTFSFSDFSGSDVRVVESIDQSNLVNVPPGFGAGQMGNLALPGDNDTNFKEESLFENTIAHHLGDNPLQGSAFFNIKTPLGVADQNGNSGPRFLRFWL